MAQVIAGSQNPVRVLVIGGTLFVGKELVRRVLERGYDVTVLHRGGHRPPAGVQEIVCDRNDSEAVRLALRGRSFDLVFDHVYDWGRGTTAEHVRATPRRAEPKYVATSSCPPLRRTDSPAATHLKRHRWD